MSEDTKKGKLDIPIDSISLKNYLSNKFAPVSQYIRKEFENHSKEIVKEMINFGLKNLSDLDKLINETDFIEKVKIYGEKTNLSSNYIGTLRRLMIIADAEKYFTECYDGQWSEFPDSAFSKFLIGNGVDILKVSKGHRAFC